MPMCYCDTLISGQCLSGRTVALLVCAARSAAG